MPPRDANAGKAEAATERRLHAFELRKAGASYRAIGQALGISHVQARRDVEWVLADLNRQTRSVAENYRRLQLERLNDMLLALWPAVRQGDPTAIHRALAVMEREAKLLGLDAPAKVEWQLQLRREAESIAGELGLDVEEVMAEAERIAKGKEA